MVLLLTQLDPNASAGAIIMGMYVEDDRGTEYRRLGTEGPRWGRWEQPFTPGVPTDASQLRITIGNEQFDVRLPSNR